MMAAELDKSNGHIILLKVELPAARLRKTLRITKNTLRKLLSRIDRDRVADIEESNSHQCQEYHEIVNLTCDKCKESKLYRSGNDCDYFLHCSKCGKVDRVLSL
jgi:hypothetical protein